MPTVRRPLNWFQYHGDSRHWHEDTGRFFIGCYAANRGKTEWTLQDRDKNHNYYPKGMAKCKELANLLVAGEPLRVTNKIARRYYG